MTEVRSTHRWRGVIGVALVTAACGVLANRPSLLFLSTVGVVFAVYPRIGAVPPVDIALERRVSDASPAPGERVTVTVTVANRSDRPVWDLRIVDGVPSALRVVDGTPRHGTTLRSGKQTSFSYVLEAQPGTYGFDPATVVARDPSGSTEVETTVAAETELVCPSEVRRVPARPKALPFAGRITMNVGGTGTEFYRTRTYRSGDPLGRIDWNRYARTNELTTVEYREERATTVILVVDAREVAYRGRPDGPHAVSYAVTAAAQLLRPLLAGRNWVGIAGVGRSLCWLEPGAGREHGQQAERLLRTQHTFASSPPDDEGDHDRQLRSLRKRLSGAAQVVLLSPLTDDPILTFARMLEAEGHPVTIISPDVTGGETAGQRVAALDRLNRVSVARRSGIPVLDWTTAEPLAVALERGQDA